MSLRKELEELEKESTALAEARTGLDREISKQLALLALDLKKARFERNENIKNFEIYKVEEILLKISTLFSK